MSATETSPVFNIAFLSDLPSEAMETGPIGRAYRAQLAAEWATRSYERTYEIVAEQLDQTSRNGGGLGAAPAGDHPQVVAAREKMDQAVLTVKSHQTTIGGIAFCLAVDNVEKAQKKLASLNRKGLTEKPITLTLSDERVFLDYQYEEGREGSADHAIFEHVFAVLAGDMPVIPGYKFLASITSTDHGNLVQRLFGDDEMIDLSRFRDTGSACEHCNKVRIRTNTYIIHNEETGDTKQVGRTCLRDFTGANDPERIVKGMEQYFEFMRTLSSRSESPQLPILTFLTHVACMIREEGFRKDMVKTGDQATSNIYYMTEKVRDKKTGRPFWVDPIDADVNRAKAVLKWAREEYDPSDDFGLNIKILLANDGLTPGKQNIAAWAFPKMEGDLTRKQETATAKVENADKQWIGKVKERLTLTLTITDIKWIPDNYNGGEKPLVIMVDEDGNAVKWFASNLPRIATPAGSPLKGGTYEVKGTVKDHEDHERFGKSTLITRCKFEKVINEPEED